MPQYEGYVIREQWVRTEFEAENDEAAGDWFAEHCFDNVEDETQIVSEPWDCNEGPQQV